MNPSGRNGKTGGATARNSAMREEKSQVRVMQTGGQFLTLLGMGMTASTVY